MARMCTKFMPCLVKTVKHFTVNQITDSQLFRNAPKAEAKEEKP
jgi:hypothetical protein